MENVNTDRRLSLAERRYIAARLESMGIEGLPDYEQLHEIPVVVAERDVLALLEDGDKRAAEALAMQQPVRIAAAAMTEPITVQPEPTWRAVNRGEMWTWAGIGAGTIVIVELLVVCAIAVAGVL